MVEPLIAFVLGALGTVLLVPVVIRAAERWGGLDQPGARKVHDHPVPRLGGVAIYLSFGMVALLALALVPRIRNSFAENWAFWFSLVAGATAVFLLGLYDDLRRATVGQKFLVQTLAALCVYFWGGVQITHLGIPFLETTSLGWLGMPLTLLWIVGVTNAFNLIDGLDGLAGGVAFISTITLLIIRLLQMGSGKVVLTTAALAGCLLGFLRYNRNPARIFLGDCGSMFLGFLLAVLSVVGAAKKTTAYALLIPILILGVPVFDTLFTMGRRLARKIFVERDLSVSALKAMFQADREHIHHALVEMGFTHRKAVLILYGLTAILGVFAVFAAIYENDRVSLGLILAGMGGFVFVRQFAWAKGFLSKNGSSLLPP